jgi:glutathione S-transferase
VKESIMKLYGFPPSPNTWKVRAVAHQLGIALELALIDLSKGQQRTPDYLALNPTGRTPTLVDGDLKLWESTAIMQYLASQRPNSLWPDNPRKRADIMRWQSWQLQHWSTEACAPLIFQRLVKTLMSLGAPDPAIVEKATAALEREAAVLDAHLARQPYLVGGELTLADFSTVAPLAYSKEAQMPIEPYRHIREWSARILGMPCWRETAPQPAAAAAA